MPGSVAAASISNSSPIRASPMPVCIPDTNKKRAVSTGSLESLPFRILDLPDELRLTIYRWILPYGQHIFLDPDNVGYPSPHADVVGRGDHVHKDVMAMLLVNKRIYAEVTEYIYTNNIVTVQKLSEQDDFLTYLGKAACESITQLECFVSVGLAELGDIWQTMSDCPKLESLRLVFYHEKLHWSKTLAELARYMVFHENSGLQLEVELHTSVHPRHYKTAEEYQGDFSKHFDQAHTAASIYTFDIPRPLRNITVTASVLAEAAYGFATFDDGYGWGFKKHSTTDTAGKKTLRWEKTDNA